MKKIALILAALMMFSAISVFAAPSVEYIFYGVDDTEGGTDESAFFVFGKYTNNKTTSGTWVSEDVGVYYNGTKYSYVKDGNTTNKTGLFGIAFDDKDGVKDKMTSFKVQPYSVNNYGEKLGVEQEYDFEKNEMKASSNAKLASVSILRKDQNGGGLMALMDPVFDPDTENYIIYGYFQNANYSLAEVELLCVPEDPKATIEIKNTFGTINESTGGFTQNLVDGKYANYTTVTVTAADKSNKKTYTFKFNTSSSSAYYTTATNVARPTAYFAEACEDGEYTKTVNTGNAIFAYPQNGSAKTQYFVWEFDIKDGMKTADIITLNTSNIIGTSSDNMNNVVIAARAYDDETKLGIQDGTFVIPDSNLVPIAKNTTLNKYEYCPCGINVTNIVKDAIKANQTKVKIALQIVDLETNGLNVPGFKLVYYDKLNNYSASLCWR